MFRSSFHGCEKAPLAAARIALLLLVCATSSWAQEQKPQVIMGLQNPPPVHFSDDLPPGPMQAKATTACLECHEARIILQQRLSKAVWTKEVDKMTKWGAIVDPAERDALIDYLSTNFSPDKPPYEPQRTSPDKGSSRKTK
jgi:hypothetical protein